MNIGEPVKIIEVKPQIIPVPGSLDPLPQEEESLTEPAEVETVGV